MLAKKKQKKKTELVKYLYDQNRLRVKKQEMTASDLWAAESGFVLVTVDCFTSYLKQKEELKYIS